MTVECLKFLHVCFPDVGAAAGGASGNDGDEEGAIIVRHLKEGVRCYPALLGPFLGQQNNCVVTCHTVACNVA